VDEPSDPGSIPGASTEKALVITGLFLHLSHDLSHGANNLLNASSILIVVPGSGLAVGDAELEPLALSLLGLQAPDLTLREHVHHARHFFLVGGTKMEPLTEVERKVVYRDHKRVLLDFIRALLHSHPEIVLPGAQVFRDAGKIPEGYASSEGQFLPLVAYASHPADRQFFIPVATYLPYLLQDKRAEMVRLAACLGAKSIRLLDTEQRGKRAQAHLDAKVPVDGVPVDIGAKASGHSASTSAFNLSATFGKPKREPALPPELRWYHREPLWKAMAQTRLEHGTETFKVQFKYDQDFGVNADLVGKVAGFGLSAGGSFSSMEKIEQEYEVGFHPVE